MSQPVFTFELAPNAERTEVVPILAKLLIEIDEAKKQATEGNNERP